MKENLPKEPLEALSGEAFCVPEYRHYRLDGAGSINNAEWIEAADDEDVVRQVRELRLPVPSEIWNGRRLVARIEADPPG